MRELRVHRVRVILSDEMDRIEFYLGAPTACPTMRYPPVATMSAEQGPQADAAECHFARLCSLTEELHDLFHAVGIDVRVKRGRGGYDDPMTAILDAVGEEEEFRDTLPLRPGGAAQELT